MERWCVAVEIGVYWGWEGYIRVLGGLREDRRGVGEAGSGCQGVGGAGRGSSECVGAGKGRRSVVGG